MSRNFNQFEFRAALPADEDSLVELARHLNTVNLPSDRGSLRELLRHSEQSHSAELEPVEQRRYLFLVWDRLAQRAVGTSSIVAQLGRHEAPYIYFSVLEVEKYSRLLERHFRHQTLYLGFSYAGPTELGGLVVAPEYRRHALRLGRLVSYLRFAFIKARRSWFRDQLLAELLPPLEPDGRSHLWEALGRHFTGMSYAEADFLSSQNKDFISDLFPRHPIYVSLLGDAAAGVIGQVGETTRPVERMLTQVGFQYAQRIDPFDGGPHFTAATDRVSLVEKTRRVALSPMPLATSIDAPEPPLSTQATAPRHSLSLTLRLSREAPFMRACYGPASYDAESDALSIPEAHWELLGTKPGETLYQLPLT